MFMYPVLSYIACSSPNVRVVVENCPPVYLVLQIPNVLVLLR